MSQPSTFGFVFDCMVEGIRRTSKHVTVAWYNPSTHVVIEIVSVTGQGRGRAGQGRASKPSFLPIFMHHESARNHQVFDVMLLSVFLSHHSLLLCGQSISVDRVQYQQG